MWGKPHYRPCTEVLYDTIVTCPLGVSALELQQLLQWIRIFPVQCAVNVVQKLAVGIGCWNKRWALSLTLAIPSSLHYVKHAFDTRTKCLLSYFTLTFHSSLVGQTTCNFASSYIQEKIFLKPKNIKFFPNILFSLVHCQNFERFLLLPTAHVFN